ncbi:MAG: hypothetical protein WCF84_27505 [Anaerolineae bacterium]
MKQALVLFAALVFLIGSVSACTVVANNPITVPPPTIAPNNPITVAPPTVAANNPTVIPLTRAPVAAAVCPILATRTPPPAAPTFMPGGPSPKTGAVDPHIELCASAATIRVGETLTLTGVPVDIGLPYYILSVRDTGSGEFAQLAGVTYENRPNGLAQPSAMFEFVSAKGSMREVTFVLRARQAGAAIVYISATGEIHYGYPGPATNAGGGSEPAMITVQK